MFAQGALLAGQSPLPLLVQRTLVFSHLRGFGDHFFRQLERPAFGFGRKPFDLRGQGKAIGFAFALVRQVAGVIQAQQGVALVHHLSFTDENFSDDAALQVLDHLDLA
ncbi:hypothetical protein D3C79_1000270 [compost metagenome]